ncbi:hypothetical protein PoMZ_03268 [Pyricularia oryzae]|uniref:Uncharacterized protein n=1 Tax=Pyricularia oryzae TaxID=318829 RepID=A0A4P7N6U0_PYROR|nr:hypothetical protein PoMZ_03268 [Pyricularia oryzae]
MQHGVTLIAIPCRSTHGCAAALRIDTDCTEPGRLADGADAALLSSRFGGLITRWRDERTRQQRSAGHVQLHVLNVHGHLCGKVAHDTAGAGDGAGLEERVDGDGVQGVGRLAAEPRGERGLGQQVHLPSAAVRFDPGEGLQRAAKVQALLHKLPVPGARGALLHGLILDGEASGRRAVVVLRQFDQTVGVSRRLPRHEGADYKLVPPPRPRRRRAGSGGRLQRGKDLDAALLVVEHHEGLFHMHMAQRKAAPRRPAPVPLQTQPGALAGGLDGHGEVAGGGQDGGGVELVADEPGEVGGAQHVAPLARDAVAARDAGAEQVVARVRAVAPLDAGPRLVEARAAVVVPHVPG